MKTKIKILSFLIAFLFILFFCTYIAKNRNTRSHTALQHRYYMLKKMQHANAEHVLHIILKSDPKNAFALAELKNITHSQLIKLEQTSHPVVFFILHWKELISNMTQPYYLKNIHPIMTTEKKIIFTDQNKPRTLNYHDDQAKIKSKSQKQLIFSKPQQNNSNIQSEIIKLNSLGYEEIKSKNNLQAIRYFETSYHLKQDPFIALQLGYLFDINKNKNIAVIYFQRASQTKHVEIQKKAEDALINLSSAQQQLLPAPLFAEFFSTPLYQTRFALQITPIILRFGYTLNSNYQLDVYSSFRLVKDNQTTSNFLISQIYEDNVAVYSFGIRAQPIPSMPLLVFAEAGRAADLVQRQRPIWRDDWRGGLVYYKNWGGKLEYFPTWAYLSKSFGDLYSEFIYYSRFNNNLITTHRFREGFDLLSYKNFIIKTYGLTRLSFDKNREFFNNFIEYGPGIAVIPNNHWNLTFRYENLHGQFISVNSPTPNPYGHSYHNQLFQLEYYVKI